MIPKVIEGDWKLLTGTMWRSRWDGFDISFDSMGMILMEALKFLARKG